MFDLKIIDLSKTEDEEGYVDFIALTNEQWAMVKANIEMLKNHEKCELMYTEDFKKSIDGAKEDAIDEFLNKAKERIGGLMDAEIQGQDMCPFSEIGDGSCIYINSDIGCSYCTRKVDIEELEQIANQLREQK